MVWAYFILDAAALATAKYTDLPRKSVSYQVQEEPSELHPYYSRLNATVSLDQDVLPSQLGLFVAQPSVQPLKEGPDPVSIGPESRYGRNFGFIPLTKKRRGAQPERLSLFSKLDRPRFKDRRKFNDPDARPLASDHYLTPEFVKFKNEIEREAEKTHVKGLKMSKDAEYSPTIVYERPVMRRPKDKRKPFHRNPMPLADDSYQKPTYEEPESYDDYSSYPKPGSYPSHFSSSNDYSSYPKSTSYQSQSTVPSEPYLPPGFDSSDFTFPPYPPLPAVESEPYHPPHSESEARNPAFNSLKDYPYPNDDPPSYTFPKSRIPSSYPKDDEESEPENQSPDGEDTYYKPRKYLDSEAYRRPLSSDDSDSTTGRKEKPFRVRSRPSRIGRPYGKPAQVSIPVSRNEEEEDDFDSTFETPSASDTFLNDEEAEEEEEEEEEKPSPLPAPKGRLRQSSRQQNKRVHPGAGRKKRCVKKRKEMSIDDPEDEPGREMSCLVCENLDTGGTYETCSYESDPKKDSYLVGNEALYRKSGPRGSSKHRYKRHTLVVSTVQPPKRRVIRRTYEESGSYAADPDDFESENFEDEDEDDMAEYKPQPPAYANDDSCTEVKKGNAICMVCQNPESNGKYEQCSYANDPGEDTYEYAQSSRYGSGSKQAPSKKRKERHRRKSERKPAEEVKPASGNATADSGKPATENATATLNASKSGQASNNHQTRMPLEWQGLRDVEQQKIESVNKMFHSLVRTKKEQPDSRFLADVEDSSYEEQFLNLFPELSGGSGEFKRSLLNDFDEKPILGKEEYIPGFKTKSKLGGYFSSLPKKSILDDRSGEETEMSKMMKEFASKDRSACTKRMKDKMTCYVCDDTDGIKREECMYVVENEPKKVSYQESKHSQTPEGKTAKREIRKRPLNYKYKFVPPGEMESSATLVDTRKYGSPRNPNSYSNLQIHSQKTFSREGTPFGRHVRRIPEDPEVRGSSRRKRYKKEGNDEEETVSEDPEETGEYQSEEVTLEADPTSPDGAFSDDTKTVFDKELKISLPKFMVEKSEHEEMIDEFMSRL